LYGALLGEGLPKWRTAVEVNGIKMNIQYSIQNIQFSFFPSRINAFKSNIIQISHRQKAVLRVGFPKRRAGVGVNGK